MCVYTCVYNMCILYFIQLTNFFPIGFLASDSVLLLPKLSPMRPIFPWLSVPTTHNGVDPIRVVLPVTVQWPVGLANYYSPSTCIVWSAQASNWYIPLSPFWQASYFKVFCFTGLLCASDCPYISHKRLTSFALALFYELLNSRDNVTSMAVLLA